MRALDEDGMKHLDVEVFAELTLGGGPDAGTQVHLESCTACREELARFAESVGSFNMASLAWSEGKSKTLPPPRTVAQSKGKKGGAEVPRLTPGLSWAMAALLAIGVAVPAAKMHFSTAHDVEARNGAGALDDDRSGLNSPEQIAKDNQLMADVDYELTHSQAVLLWQYDRQRGAGADAGVTETGKRSR